MAGIEINQLDRQSRYYRNSVYTDISTLHLESPILCSSTDTEYIPYYAIFSNEKFVVGDKRFSLYGIMSRQHANTERSSTRGLQGFLFDPWRPTPIRKDNRIYYLYKHCIYEMVGEVFEPLFVLVIKDNYWRTMEQSTFDYSQLRLIISSKFQAEERKSMFNYIMKYIVPLYTSLTIDLIFTSDVTRYCFKSFANPVEFSTIAERRRYSNQLTDKVLTEFFQIPSPTISEPTVELDLSSLEELPTPNVLTQGGWQYIHIGDEGNPPISRSEYDLINTEEIARRIDGMRATEIHIDEAGSFPFDLAEIGDMDHNTTLNEDEESDFTEEELDNIDLADGNTELSQQIINASIEQLRSENSTEMDSTTRITTTGDSTITYSVGFDPYRPAGENDPSGSTIITTRQSNSEGTEAIIARYGHNPGWR